MIYSMKAMNLSGLQKEFLMLTEFHGDRAVECIDKMDIDQEIKDKMTHSIMGFRKDLFEMASYSPEKNEVLHSMCERYAA